MTANNHDNNDLIPLDRHLKALLRSETKRTGAGPRELLRGNGSVPAGLTPRIVNRWLLGAVTHVQKAQIDYILAAFAALPDKHEIFHAELHRAKPGRRVQPEGGNWQPLTSGMIDHLHREFRRTGLRSASFLVQCSDTPRGFTKGVIENWRQGRSKTVNPDLWRYAIERLAALPDRAVSVPPPKVFPISKYHLPDHRPISDTDMATLQEFRLKTGYGVSNLMRGAKDRPYGLTDAMIAGWFSERTRSADPVHLAYVIERATRIMNGATE